MDNGTTHWKVRRDITFLAYVSPIENTPYLYAFGDIPTTANKTQQVALLMDIRTGHVLDSIFVRLSDSSGKTPEWARREGGACFANRLPDDQNLVLVTYIELLPNAVCVTYFGLYNTETKDWVWDRKPLSPPSLYASVNCPPQIHNNRVYANVDASLVCHDLATGEQIWKTDFTQDFMFSNFIIADDKLIGNNEDRYMYCLNLETGAILWKVRTAGTSSCLSYLNGIVYLAGGSVPKLFGIEVSTGRMVWGIDASRLKGGKSGEVFYSVYTLPAENDEPAKVIALTNLNAYCFKAYR
jgi:hypothetical protein